MLGQWSRFRSFEPLACSMLNSHRRKSGGKAIGLWSCMLMPPPRDEQSTYSKGCSNNEPTHWTDRVQRRSLHLHKGGMLTHSCLGGCLVTSIAEEQPPGCAT